MYDMNATSNPDLVSEGELFDSLLDELAAEPQGAPIEPWPVGWYSATIIEGYASRKGTQFLTSNVLSKDSSSYNLRLSVAVTHNGETRNMQAQLNYRIGDLTEARMSQVKEAREEFKGVQKWPGEAKDLQRSSLALAAIGQLRKATGAFSLIAGRVNPSVYIGKSVDVHLTLTDKDDQGKVYNEPNGFAPVGSKVGKE